MNIDLLEKNCIIICPNEKKEELVKFFSSSLEYNIKYLSKNEVINSFTFTYDDEAILYLLNKGYSFDNAMEILNHIQFVEKDETETLIRLLNIKEELLEKKLLKSNSIFKKIFENKKVYVYGYSKEDRELTKFITNYTYIEEKDNNYVHEVLEFTNIMKHERDFIFYIFKF